MPHQRTESYNQNGAGQGLVVPGNMMENHDARKGPVVQNRRLMETSNMFTVYRNSLKNNVNNNSNGFADGAAFNSLPQHFSEPHSKQGTANVGG